MTTTYCNIISWHENYTNCKKCNEPLKQVEVTEIPLAVLYKLRCDNCKSEYQLIYQKKNDFDTIYKLTTVKEHTT